MVPQYITQPPYIPVVGDHNERVNVLAQRLDAVDGLLCAAAALKGKGVGDDADGQDTSLARDARNDGCCAGTGATTHAGGDEDLRVVSLLLTIAWCAYHIGTGNSLVQRLVRLLGSQLAQLRLATRSCGDRRADIHHTFQISPSRRTKSAGELSAHLHLVERLGALQGLGIGVEHPKLHTLC